MNKHKINYYIKHTKSNNTYIQMDRRDENIFIQTIMSINSYMQELCLSTDIDLKQVNNYWRSSDKRFPYNKRLGKRNTPETMIAGLINNMVFGKQDNLSLEQLPYYEEIVNTCVELIETIEVAKQLRLQQAPHMTGIIFGLGI